MLSVRDIIVRIDGRPILEGASLMVQARAKMGLVGRNGCGKSTLLRAIKGEIPVESGQIELHPRARWACVDQEVPSGTATPHDVVLSYDTERAELLAELETASDGDRIGSIHARLQEIAADSAPARAAEILAGLGFDARDQARPCSAFSGGWRMRVALAGALFARPDLLLLDEPTNYLDLEGTLWLQSYLKRFAGAVLVVSHDRDFMDAACEEIAHVRRGRITTWTGNYSAFEKALAERARLDAAASRKVEAERAHLQAFVDRFRAKASKATQAQSRLKRLAKLQPVELEPEEVVAPFRFAPADRAPAPPILALENAAVGYDQANPVLRRLNVRLDPDDRVGLLGRNGAGKSTFVKLLAGVLDLHSGERRAHAKLRVAYFAQHQLDALDAAETPYEIVARAMPLARESERRGRLGSWGLDIVRQDTPCGDLSGGERTRLLLNLVAMNGADLLILDEPTNHLDIASRDALARALLDFPGAVVLISHDRRLIDTCADRLWIVDEGTVSAFDGDLDGYARALSARPAGPTQASGQGAPKAASVDTSAERRREAARRREEFAPLKRELDKLEKEVARLSADLALLDEAIADLAGDPKRPGDMGKLAIARANCAQKLETAELTWLDKASAYEAAIGG